MPLEENLSLSLFDQHLGFLFTHCLKDRLHPLSAGHLFSSLILNTFSSFYLSLIVFVVFMFWVNLALDFVLVFRTKRSHTSARFICRLMSSADCSKLYDCLMCNCNTGTDLNVCGIRARNQKNSKKLFSMDLFVSSALCNINFTTRFL